MNMGIQRDIQRATCFFSFLFFFGGGRGALMSINKSRFSSVPSDLFIRTIADV